MDYFEIVRGGWAVVRRERGLWWLGAVEALHVLLLWLLMLSVTLPLLLVLFLAFAPQQDLPLPPIADDLSFWLSRNYVALMASMVIAFLAYAVAAVVTVAAQGGIVHQVGQALRGGPVSASRGLAAGFAMWWRTAAILALPALPSLLFLLALALMLQFMVVGPLSAGGSPDALQLRITLDAISPLSTLVSFATVPLSVWAFLALRFAILADLTWRDAYVAAWRLAKAHLKDVALLFLVIYAVMFVVAFVAEVVIGLASGLLSLVAILSWSMGGVAVAIAFVAFAALVAMIALAGVSAGIALVTSAVWTLFWTRLQPQPVRSELFHGREEFA